jgi:hypothetical protein|tara:strand:- start:432 stop:686 length:255 start_codon:yes stop_codon:yes gene_type:complete
MDHLKVAINNYALPAPVSTQVEIILSEVVLNSHATIVVHLLDANGNLLDNKFVKIEGEEYDNWSSDDNYIVDLALTKLGLTKSV